MPSLSERCSVIIVPYNHEDFIEACVDSVLECDPKEVLVVDGGSSDDTRALVRDMDSPVELITVEGNPGYGACNNVGVEQATGEYLLILNPDTKLEPGTLDQLLEPLDSRGTNPTVTVPKILTYDGSCINTVGNINHISGLAFVQGFEDSPDEWSTSKTLTGLSGACFAIRKDDFQRLNGFDDSIFIYMEDVEFSWRLNAHADRIRFVPNAVVYHDYDDIVVDAAKLKHLEIGRYIILRKYLDAGTSARLLPSLLMAEILTFGYAILLGKQGLENKLEAIKVAVLTEVKPVQVDSQRLVRRLDSEIPEDGIVKIPAASVVLRFANLVFKFNLRLING